MHVCNIFGRIQGTHVLINYLWPKEFVIHSDHESLKHIKSQDDEDMTTLDMTKNIAYMHICQVISSANNGTPLQVYGTFVQFTY